jgi:hypothetical protein
MWLIEQLLPVRFSVEAAGLTSVNTAARAPLKLVSCAPC